jgi:Bifunctional DNA primase/polymerase, N-terminal
VAVVGDPGPVRLHGGGVMASGVLGQALAYAAAGWPVFPCRPNADPCPAPARCECKAPLTVHGFLDATTDPAVIGAWWSRWPAGNVAIATGAPGPDVLDVDVSTEGSGWAGFNRLKRAGLLTGAQAIVRTPRGGLHVYFAGTGQGCGSLTRAGHFIDFKAAGGYVLAPPSRIHGQPYELLDHRDGTARLDWQAVRQVLDPPRAGRPTLPRNGGGRDITRLAEWVAAQPEGNRNAGLYWAARRALESALDPAGLVPAAIQAGLSETEAHRTIESARRASQ